MFNGSDRAKPSKNLNKKNVILETLISSKTRIKLLLKFFLNSKTKGYLRGLSQEFGESTNSIRIELNRLEKAGMLKTEFQGNKKFFQANTNHPLFNEINSIISKYLGLDKIIEQVATRIGELNQVYLTGDLSMGRDSDYIELLLLGESINLEYLNKLIKKSEQLINKKIEFLHCTKKEFESIDSKLLLWEKE